MIQMTNQQKYAAGNGIIALLILTLAFLLKDADPSSQATGFYTILAAIFIRLSGLNVLGVNQKHCAKSN